MKGKIFCPQCGKTDVELFSGLCRSCFIEKTDLISFPDEIEVTICTHCGSVQKKGRWIESDLSLDQTVKETIKEYIEVDECASNPEMSVKILNTRGSIFECLVEVKAELLGLNIIQEFPVEVKVNKNVCTECSKFASGYYEAVIQIRAYDRIPSPEELETADRIVKENIERLSQKNRMAYVSKRVEMKEGIDYYVGSYKAARKLTESLKNVFGGVLKESPRLMGRDKSAGKDLYRIWISLRLPQFQKGDFVKYDATKAQVIGFDGNKISLRDLESAGNTSLSWKEYEKLTIIGTKKDVKSAMVTSKSPQSIQILHPETYQPVDIAMDKKLADKLSHVQIGEELKVVEIEGVLYVL